MEAWEDADAAEDVLTDADRQWRFQGGKDATIFLVEASRDMHKKVDGQNETHLTKALRAVHADLRNKIFQSPGDPVGVLLYGTANKVDIQDFENLSCLLPLENPSAAAIGKLETICKDLNGEEEMEEPFADKYGAGDAFSMHEALWQCQSLFADVQGKVAKKRIVLLTAVDDPHAADAQKKRQAMQKAKDLHETGVVLDVLPLTKDFRMDKFFKDLIRLADEDEDAANALAADPQERFEDLVQVIRKRTHKKRSIGKVRLDLGGGVKISVATYNFVQKAYKPSKVKLAQDTNDEVKIQRTFINHMTGAPLLPSDINKFQDYGGKRIKFTLDEIKGMTMLDGEVGLRLCGFKPMSNLKWGSFVRSGNFIYPEERVIKGSRPLFAALLIKCLERKVYALAAYKVSFCPASGTLF